MQQASFLKWARRALIGTLLLMTLLWGALFGSSLNPSGPLDAGNIAAVSAAPEDCGGGGAVPPEWHPGCPPLPTPTYTPTATPTRTAGGPQF